jgi:hypothetical protein
MSRGARAFGLALVGVGLISLGVVGPLGLSRGSAQDSDVKASDVNQAGEIVAAPPPATVSNTPPPSLAAAPPPESAPTDAAPAVSVDANLTSDAESDDDRVPSPAPPLARPRYTTAVLQALDKVTAETLRFEATVGEPVRYRDLVITVHDCETTAANEAQKDSIVQMDVQYQPAVLSGGASAVRSVFRGWMFAQSPGLHPFANPIYDVWVIACKTPAPAPTASASPANEASPPANVVGASR